MNITATDRAAILTALHAAEHAAESAMTLLSNAHGQAENDTAREEVFRLHQQVSAGADSLRSARATMGDHGAPRVAR